MHDLIRGVRSTIGQRALTLAVNLSGNRLTRAVPKKKAVRDGRIGRFKNNPIDELHKLAAEPEGRFLAFSLLNSPLTEKLGRSLLARAVGKNEFVDFVSDLLSDVPADFISDHNLDVAVYAFSRHDPGKFLALIDYVCTHGRPVPPTAVADAAMGLLQLEDFDRYQRFTSTYLKTALEQKPELGRTFSLLDRWVEKHKRSKQLPPPSGTTAAHFGLLSYFIPASTPSTNIGDYFQSIAMLGQLLRAGLKPSDTEIPRAIERIFERLGTNNSEAEFPHHLSAVDRDDPSTQISRETVWLPVFGWHSHRKFDREHDLQFAENIRPLFISFNISRPDIITPESLKILKRYAPIGCRDYNTVRLLRSLGVRAFFSGCVTSTLGDIYRAPRRKTREKLAAGYDEKRFDTPVGYAFVPHLIPNLESVPLDDALLLADTHLDRYAKAGHVTTNLLHCFLPCRSFGTKVTFTHKKLSDRRFDGLIDASDVDLAAMHRIFAKFREVIGLILEGKSEQEIYDRWRALWAEEEAATDAVLRTHNQAVDMESRKTWVEQSIDRIDRATLKLSNASPGEERVDICFAFDSKMAEFVETTVRSVCMASSQPIRFHFLTREVTAETLEHLAARLPDCEIQTYRMDPIQYKGLRLLSHTTVSTMDRLLIPEILKEVDRVIYLDVDVVARNDIAELWRTPMADAPLAARLSIYKEWKRGVSLSFEIAERYDEADARSLRNYIFNTGSVDFDCFNAGVLLMNLRRMRAEQFCATAAHLVDTWGLHDQYVLNIYARGNFVRLDPRWNHFPTQEFQTNPHIVHFIGPVKPWHNRAYRFANDWECHRKRA
jgi:lipopolysaccharide biosynthesis glycosyltransferase